MSDIQATHKISGVKDILKDGETRRFLDYDNTINVGTIKHNINNMWWVLKGTGEVRNVANFEIYEIAESEQPGKTEHSGIPTRSKAKHEKDYDISRH